MSLLGRLLNGGSPGNYDQVIHTPRAAFGATNELATMETAMKVSSWYAAHRILSTQFAKAPLVLYKRTKDGGREKADHDLGSLLLLAPNSQQDAFMFKQYGFSHTFFNGNIYCYKDFEGSTKSLIPLNPARVEVRQKVSGELYYKYRYSNGGTDDFRNDQILHWRGMTLDGLVGVSLVTYAATQIGIADKQVAHQAHQLLNRAFPAGTLEVPGVMPKETKQKFRDDWKELYTGPENSGGLILLDNGMTFKPQQFNNKDMEYLADKRFTVQDTSRFTGVPPILLFDNSESTWNNANEANRMFLEYGLDPWLVGFEMALNTQVLTPRERERYFFEFDRSAYDKMDAEKTSVALLNGRYGGWIQADEARAKFNMPPLPGGIGKIVWRPENMAPADAEYQPNNPTKANQNTAETGGKQEKTPPKVVKSELSEQEREIYSRLLNQVLRRMSTKALTHKEKLQRKHGTTYDVSIFSKWMLENIDMFRQEFWPAYCAVRAAQGATIYSPSLHSWRELIEAPDAEAEAVAAEVTKWFLDESPIGSNDHE